MIFRTLEFHLPAAGIYEMPTALSRRPAAGSLGLSLAAHATAVLIVLSWPVSSPSTPHSAPLEHGALIAPPPKRPQATRKSESLDRSVRPRLLRPGQKPFREAVRVPTAVAKANWPFEFSLPELDFHLSALPDVESPRLTLSKPPPSTGNLTEARVAPPPAPESRVLSQSDRFTAAETAAPDLVRRPAASTSFGDAQIAAPPARSASGIIKVPASAVEILFKPRPAYTEEARRLRIEGEVLLEVLFEASGQIRVTKLVQGLGHGLDEAAGNAARQIRFRPARRGGVPIGAVGIVHIVFELAY
jgi:TonB family protein